MSDERWLITGALGCIGTWCCRQLAGEGHPVTAFDLGSDWHRADLVMTPQDRAAVDLVHGDITDLDAIERVLREREITHVIHLAAMLVPLAAADPPRGAMVNVGGTVHVFEAVKRCGLPGLAYASSAAVYDRTDGVRVVEDADGHPINHYGVHKQANEGAARVYWRDDGVASIGLRPHIVYGPGRDHGMTAGPTLAMAAAVRGERYEIQHSKNLILVSADGARECKRELERDTNRGEILIWRRTARPLRVQQRLRLLEERPGEGILRVVRAVGEIHLADNLARVCVDHVDVIGPDVLSRRHIE